MSQEKLLKVFRNETGGNLNNFLIQVGELHEQNPIVHLRGVMNGVAMFGGSDENVERFAEALNQAGFTTRIEPGRMG